ncbi:hypothetical protein RKE25_19780 [Dyella sp. BiH032]|uniref:hypothetical protein n=1 Tax=Dyella sp. BiH032 TaxID=3075430 RepID=UPI0028937C9D|nr:hypothetical protein [Dyella sp. BiH032]WNL45627.1 hypothetical protein RKE25_19780 [Dyella sp. BiH032]
MFILQIEVDSIEDGERILDTLRAVALQGAADSKKDCATESPHPAIRLPEHPVPDDVRRAMSALQAKHGISNVGVPVALLERFGVDSLRQLRPEQHADFIAACAEA